MTPSIYNTAQVLAAVWGALVWGRRGAGAVCGHNTASAHVQRNHSAELMTESHAVPAPDSVYFVTVCVQNCTQDLQLLTSRRCILAGCDDPQALRCATTRLGACVWSLARLHPQSSERDPQIITATGRRGQLAGATRLRLSVADGCALCQDACSFSPSSCRADGPYVTLKYATGTAHANTQHCSSFG